MQINNKAYKRIDFHSEYRLKEILASLLMDDVDYDETFKSFMGYNRPFCITPIANRIRKNLFTVVYEIRIDMDIRYDLKKYFIDLLRKKLYHIYGIKVLRKYPYNINLTYRQMDNLITLLKLKGEI